MAMGADRYCALTIQLQLENAMLLPVISIFAEMTGREILPGSRTCRSRLRIVRSLLT
jgi:hypothetical protein